MRTGAALICLLLATSAGAQYREGDQTRDHEYLDSRYQERHDGGQKNYASPEEFLERADQLIRDRNYHADSSERYRVQTDDPRLDTKATVALLDAFREYFDSFWRGRVKLADYDSRSRVFLFYSFHKFNQLLEGDHRLDTIRPEGHYGSLFDVITIHTDAGCPADLADSLVHEAAHQLIDQRILGAEEGRQEPWLVEGLSSYFGFTFQDSTGVFITGVVGGKRSPLLRDVRGGRCNGIKEAIKAARKTLNERAKEGGSAVDMLLGTANPAAFYGPGGRENHALSWLLVHYLLDGEAGARRDAFIAYLGLASRGAVRGERLLELLGMTAAELDAALAEHLKGLKVKK